MAIKATRFTSSEPVRWRIMVAKSKITHMLKVWKHSGRLPQRLANGRASWSQIPHRKCNAMRTKRGSAPASRSACDIPAPDM